MEKQINFELSDIQRIDFEEYNDDEFSVARMTFLGSNPNSHRLIISEEVLQKYSNTALGKWLVAKMNYTGTDMEGHEPTETIMGIVPKDQEVEFVRDEEGFLRAYVDVVISKIYARDFYEVMKQDGQHSVSVEMLVNSDDYDGIGEIVHSFNILGITCLGRKIAPSCVGANIELVRFAEEAETFFKEKDETSKASINNETKETMSDNTNEERKEGDAKMAENINKDENELEFAEPESEKEKEELEQPAEELAKDESTEELAEEENLAEESTEELAKDEPAEMGKPAEDEKLEQPAEELAKDEEDEKELSVEELKKQLEEKDNIIMEKDAELAELKEFKEAKECAEKDELVSQTLATVKQAFSEKDYNALEAEGRACKLSEVAGWQNKVKAMAFDGLTNNKEFKFEQAEVNTFGGDKHEETIQKTSSGLWIK